MLSTVHAGFGALAVLAAVAITPDRAGAQLPSDPRADLSARFEIVVHGPEETVLPHRNPWGVRYTPDGPVSYRRTGEEVRMWFTAENHTVVFDGPDFDHLAPQAGFRGQAVKSFTPSGAGFDRDYAGAYSVVPAHDGRDLLMFYHAERHPCRGGMPFQGSIGLARSSDGGLTWVRKGQVLSTGAPEPTGCGFGAWGVGSPSVYVSPDGQWLYMLFSEWFRGDPLHRSDALYLARAPIESDGMPGSWWKFADGSFAEPGLGGVGTPVITEQPPGRANHYAGLPSVSYNTVLGRYLVVLQSRNGFYAATSADGIVWEQPRLLWEQPDIHVGRDQGVRWVAYPSLVSPDEPSQMTTGASGYLYYARGHPRGRQPHELSRRRFTIGVGPPTIRSSAVEREKQWRSSSEHGSGAGRGSACAPRVGGLHFIIHPSLIRRRPLGFKLPRNGEAAGVVPPREHLCAHDAEVEEPRRSAG